MEPSRILVVDDDRELGETLQVALTHDGSTVAYASSGAEALRVLSEQPFDAVLTDLAMAGMNGLELCERIVATMPEIPVVMLTANNKMEAAVGALRVGAFDFVTKPPDLDAILRAVRRAVDHHRLRTEVHRLRTALANVEHFGELTGTSPAMKELFEILPRAAESESAVLILGESGTGKELTARGLHRRSPRRDRPFVALNCAALPEHLLESELFGYVRGAFTDAKTDRAGLLVSAQGGTVFLDEIGDMPLSLQPKLLRALEERRVRPIGAREEVPFDARIIAATHRDLAAAAEEGTFRTDLYFRLNVIEINLPPLRARSGDILSLAQGFVEHFATRADRPVKGFSAEVAKRLVAYRWPGNVRELRNCIERAVALTRSTELTVDDLPPVVQSFAARTLPAAQQPATPVELLSLEAVERAHIERVLQSVEGNKREAALVLGVDRKTLYRKLEKWAPPLAAPSSEPPPES